MQSIIKSVEHDYGTLRQELYALVGKYPFIHLERLGKTVMGREILALEIGKRPAYTLYAAAFHGKERITAAVALRFAERICEGAKRRRSDNHQDDITVMTAVLKKSV